MTKPPFRVAMFDLWRVMGVNDTNFWQTMMTDHQFFWGGTLSDKPI
jgi:hypothetical protein